MVMELLRRVCKSGGKVSHKYKEGKFQAKVVGITINGKKQRPCKTLAPKIYKLTISGNLAINV
jgi:hypothetical protein